MSDVKTHYRLPLRLYEDTSGDYAEERREVWDRWFYQPVPPAVGQLVEVYPDYQVAIAKVVIELDDDDGDHDYCMVAYLGDMLPASVAPGADAGERAVTQYLSERDWERIDPPPDDESVLTNDDRRILGLTQDHIRTEIDEIADFDLADDDEQRHDGHKIYVSAVMGAGYIRVGAVTDSRPLVRLEWERFGCDEARELAADLIAAAERAEENSTF